MVSFKNFIDSIIYRCNDSIVCRMNCYVIIYDFFRENYIWYIFNVYNFI